MYVTLLFLKRIRGNLVFLGMLVLIVCYLVSKSLGLQLSHIILKYFSSAAVIVLAIVFQVEIRRYLELVGLISTRRLKTKKLSETLSTTEEIVQACVQMAQANIGALIVLQGEDNLDQLIEGGILLDGAVSEEILTSIFDPATSGHDGAVIIINDRILKFGAQLPLSGNFKEIGRHGTRHSAGLGLAERSDALVIIVSEEKGTISIAHKSKLKKLTQFNQLEAILKKGTSHKGVSRKKSALKDILTHNLTYKAAAIVITLILKLLLITTK